MSTDTPGGRAALLAAARAELETNGHAGISLRAVARRAGVSHAAPKYHFPDRAALLTAIATEGFAALTAALRDAARAQPDDLLAGLGRAYIDFGLTNPALFDLMFRPSELHTDDPDLRQAQNEAIGELGAAARQVPGADDESLTLISWALAHGLVVLTRDGALQSATGTATAEPAATARKLAEFFVAQVRS
jgi:AcrR family transcriptional regulator